MNYGITFLRLASLVDNTVNMQYSEFTRLCWTHAAYFYKQWVIYSAEAAMEDLHEDNRARAAKYVVEYKNKFIQEIKGMKECVEFYEQWVGVNIA